MQAAWEGFAPGTWTDEVDVRDFIQRNYTPYEGDESFLAGPTERTRELWATVMDLFAQERAQGGVLDMDTKTVTGIVAHPAGYIDPAHPERETIVGLQTDKPLKRALHVNGGIRISVQAAAQHGYQIDPDVVETYTYRRKTHNAGVFDVYTPEMRACRSSHIITGLPDGYGRGRIIGDYRRVALYGVDYLIKDKEAQKASTPVVMTEENIRDREELTEQIRALGQLKMMADFYGFDISGPATNVQEAIQWMYFAYLASVKDQNGAAMSMGRTSTFIDIYAERDLARGTFTEEQIQEFVDHFIMKLRMVKFARTPEYQNLFSGDPQWVTESIGGMGVDGRTLVTKTAFRYLHTLENMGTSPEPNLTVLWSTNLPQKFKEFCAKASIASSSIQYENDDVMRVYHGDDYAIACCVSSMRVGKEMQFFGARANLAKCLLYALNGGVDEITKKQIGPAYRPVVGDTLDYDDVMAKFRDMMRWLAGVYVNALNIIHYMHDKYCYEAIQMALHDKHVKRWFATGIAGLSVVADSLSAIKYARVHPVRDEQGVIVDFEIEGEFPKYGNDDDRVDTIAHDIVHEFMEFIRMNDTYRDSVPT
ncbi:pyruvate formate lyase family protein, partial [Collinsella intestinalis]|uniref:pyruvate formate lyase family protein n=1 Tax=Collinsella intestinalis TaxID=147207 RepID=UPI0025A37105